MAKKKKSEAPLETTAAVDNAEYVKARVKTGDSFIRLPNRMLVVDNGWVVASRDEYRQLVKMGVC